MSLALKLYLIAHVVFGLIGTFAFANMWSSLLRDKIRVAALRTNALWAVLSILISWVTIAIYYVTFYGAKVRPVILKGKFAWAHSVLTETKEHAFLFLPFIAVVLLVAVWKLREGDMLETSTRRQLAWLAAFATLLASGITLAGVAISGAAR